MLEYVVEAGMLARNEYLLVAIRVCVCRIGMYAQSHSPLVYNTRYSSMNQHTWHPYARNILTINYFYFDSVPAATTTTTQLCMTVTGLKRVVVTGMGIVSCLGNTVDDVANSLKQAQSGITFSEEFAELGIKSQVRGIPALSDDEMKELIPKADLRFMGTNAKYAYIAMSNAVAHSGLKPEEYQENPRVAAIIGQGGTVRI
jgi:hypothetical protein